MAKIIEVATSLPPLPAASVDFDALQQALRAGKTGEDALAIALAAPVSAPAPAPELPSAPAE